MIRQIYKKDFFNFQDYCSQFANNLFPNYDLKSIEKEFKQLFKTKKTAIVDEEKGQIRGILFIENLGTHYYIQATYKSTQILDRLLMFLTWNFTKDLVLQLNDYKAVATIKKYFFRFHEKKNNDYIYFRKYIKRINTNVQL